MCLKVQCVGFFITLEGLCDAFVVAFLFCYNCFFGSHEEEHDVSDVQRNASDENHRRVDGCRMEVNYDF